jgi:hypothetical protein
MVLIKFIIHYSLHFVLPIFIAKKWYNEQWIKSILMLWSTMIIDIDHVWAIPIFDACRCSVGFHTFHTMPFISLYIFLCFIPKIRIIGIGLILHIITDMIDCQLSMLTC